MRNDEIQQNNTVTQAPSTALRSPFLSEEGFKNKLLCILTSTIRIFYFVSSLIFPTEIYFCSFNSMYLIGADSCSSHLTTNCIARFKPIFVNFIGVILFTSFGCVLYVGENQIIHEG